MIVCSNDDPRVTLTCFTARSNLATGFSMGNSENSGFIINYCSQLPESACIRLRNSPAFGGIYSVQWRKVRRS